MQKMNNKLQKTEETVQLLAEKHHLYIFNDWALTRKFINKEEHLGIRKLLSSVSVKDINIAKDVLEVKVKTGTL
jgi:hypothetical protein